MFRKINGNYKVVEINNVVALRAGAIIAQAPLMKDGEYAEKDVVENGFVLFLDIDGELKAPKDATMTAVPVLHYTEELFTDRYIGLNTFAVPFVDGVAYPRGLVLTVGDTFTTDNVDEVGTGLYVIGDDGSFEEADTANGHTFYGVETTLPDGVTPAVELTYLGGAA